MRLFRRFKGMIRPNMAVGFDDSRQVADRKSVWMVGYLRARRANATIGMTAFYRRNHFEARANRGLRC